MTLPVWAAWAVAAIAILLPVTWAVRMVVGYWRNLHRQPTAELWRPLAAVILLVRGADPVLGQCIRGLMRQEYPRYQVHIVIDHEADPAQEIVQSVLSEPPMHSVDVRVNVLRKPRKTCSLKVSSQLQALSELDAGVDVVAFGGVPAILIASGGGEQSFASVSRKLIQSTVEMDDALTGTVEPLVGRP